jgi:hypothetical protein
MPLNDLKMTRIKVWNKNIALNIKPCIGQMLPYFTFKSTEREDMSPCFYQVWWALLLNHKNTSFFFFAVLVTKSSDWLQNILYSKRPETVFFIFPHNPVYMFRDPWVLINRTSRIGPGLIICVWDSPFFLQKITKNTCSNLILRI